MNAATSAPNAFKPDHPSDYLSPLRVALALGVSESSVKRWCDAGVLPSVRTAGGHRRIRRASLAKLAHSGGPPVVNPAALHRRRRKDGPPAPRMDPKALVRVLLRDDSAGVARMIEGLRAAGASFDRMADRLLQPALSALGERWEQGRIEIFEERRACELVQQALRRARADLLPVPNGAPLALGGSLTGDPYSLPSLLAECVLAEHGLDARSLGTGLPADTFAKAVRAKKPALVWLCLNGARHKSEASEREYAAIQEACDKVRAVLAVGGRALRTRDKAALPRAISCGTMRDLAALGGALGRAE